MAENAEKSTWKRFIDGGGFIAIAAAVIAAISLPVSYFEGQTARLLAAEGVRTEGRILSAAPRSVYRNGKQNWELRETWVFTTDAGERIEGSTLTPTGINMPRSNTVGQTFTVVYLPSDPRVYDLGVGQTSKTAQTALWLGILCVLATIGFGIRGILKARSGSA